MLCFVPFWLFMPHDVHFFIAFIYIWFNTDVADTHLIPTRRHTEIGTMVLLGIQRLTNYFFLLPLIKQSLFDLKLARWVKLHLYLKTDVGSFYGFFFPLHLLRCTSVRQKIQFYRLWDCKALIPLLQFVLGWADLYVYYS